MLKNKIRESGFRETVSQLLYDYIDYGNVFAEVTVILDQEKIEFDYNAKDKTILEALNDQGVDPPYSCRGGVCCACRAKVLEGDMLMLMNYSLTDEEVKDGYVLTCQSHPTTDKIVLSYDA